MKKSHRITVKCFFGFHAYEWLHLSSIDGDYELAVCKACGRMEHFEGDRLHWKIGGRANIEEAARSLNDRADYHEEELSRYLEMQKRLCELEESNSPITMSDLTLREKVQRTTTLMTDEEIRMMRRAASRLMEISKELNNPLK